MVGGSHCGSTSRNCPESRYGCARQSGGCTRPKPCSAHSIYASASLTDTLLFIFISRTAPSTTKLQSSERPVVLEHHEPARSEERRVGKEGGRTCRFRGGP